MAVSCLLPPSRSGTQVTSSPKLPAADFMQDITSKCLCPSCSLRLLLLSGLQQARHWRLGQGTAPVGGMWGWKRESHVLLNTQLQLAVPAHGILYKKKKRDVLKVQGKKKERVRLEEAMIHSFRPFPPPKDHSVHKRRQSLMPLALKALLVFEVLPPS